MAEYIDRQQIIGELNHIIETYMSDDTFQCFFAAAVVTDILSNVVMCQPSDDVAPVRHGKWVKQEDYSCCSECGQPIVDDCIPWFKFCANCGAKMDGGGE